MNDPCKSAKCLKYPICISRKVFQEHCSLLETYISDYVKVINPCKNKVLSPVQIRSVCRKMLGLFPNFTWVSFTVVDKTWCIIDFEEKIYKIIDDDVANDKYGINVYDFDPPEFPFPYELETKGKRDFNDNRSV